MTSKPNSSFAPSLLKVEKRPDSPPQKIRFRVRPVTQLQSTSNTLLHGQKTTRSSIASSNNNNKLTTNAENSIVPTINASLLSGSHTPSPQPQPMQLQPQLRQDSLLVLNVNNPTTITTGSTAITSTPSTPRPPQRRRVRRKGQSTPDDQAEHLTEMSVRGLDLFRYAKIFEGIYQCTECAKENIQKTFKNKYSFQRHAFLYHEGTQRKVFPCPVCSKEFSRPDKMKNHMKTTHECYMAKDPVYPLNFLAGGGGDAATTGGVPTTPTNNKTASSKRGNDRTKTNNANNTINDTPTAPVVDQQPVAAKADESLLKIDNAMSTFNAQIQANAQLIKVENASD